MIDLFTRLARDSNVHRGPVCRQAGVGLGLYFAPAEAKALAGRRKVAENHGGPPDGEAGKIWAESSGKDQGSKFIVELPMAS